MPMEQGDILCGQPDTCKNNGCKCLYNPFVNKQVYCTQCSSWYNTSCLLPLDNGEDVPMDDSSDAPREQQIIQGLGWAISKSPSLDSQYSVAMSQSSQSSEEGTPHERAEDTCHTIIHNVYSWLIWGNMRDLLNDWEWQVTEPAIVPYQMKGWEAMMANCVNFLEKDTVVWRLWCPNSKCDQKLI
jgi:hypothetical protein